MLEEGGPAGGVEVAIGEQDLARERCARCLAALREERVAEVGDGASRAGARGRAAAGRSAPGRHRRSSRRAGGRRIRSPCRSVRIGVAAGAADPTVAPALAAGHTVMRRAARAAGAFTSLRPAPYAVPDHAAAGMLARQRAHARRQAHSHFAWRQHASGHHQALRRVHPRAARPARVHGPARQARRRHDGGRGAGADPEGELRQRRDRAGGRCQADDRGGELPRRRRRRAGLSGAARRCVGPVAGRGGDPREPRPQPAYRGCRAARRARGLRRAGARFPLACGRHPGRRGPGARDDRRAGCRADLDNALAAVEFLASNEATNGNVGVVGFCWGGGMVNRWR